MTAEKKKLEYQEEKKESVLEFLLRREKGIFQYPLELTICLLSIALSIYHLFVAYAGSLEAHAFRSTHLAFVIAEFLNMPYLQVAIAGIYALTITTEGWCLSKVGWPLRVLTGVCALLFFFPGLKLAAVGLNLSLPYWLSHLLAWTLLIGFTLTHRAKYRNLAKEVPA